MGNLLPAKARKAIYLTFALLGLAQGALYVAYATLDQATPVWLKVGSAVYGFVTTAPFVVAVLNIQQGDPFLPQPASDSNAEQADDEQLPEPSEA